MLDQTILNLVLTIPAANKVQGMASKWLANLALTTETSLSAEAQEDMSASVMFYTIFATSQDPTDLNESELAMQGHRKVAPVVGN